MGGEELFLTEGRLQRDRRGEGEGKHLPSGLIEGRGDRGALAQERNRKRRTSLRIKEREGTVIGLGKKSEKCHSTKEGKRPAAGESAKPPTGFTDAYSLELDLGTFGVSGSLRKRGGGPS